VSRDDPAVRDSIKPAEAGRIINQNRYLAIMIDPYRRWLCRLIRRTTTCWRSLSVAAQIAL